MKTQMNTIAQFSNDNSQLQESNSKLKENKICLNPHIISIDSTETSLNSRMEHTTINFESKIKEIFAYQIEIFHQIPTLNQIESNPLKNLINYAVEILLKFIKSKYASGSS
jgi:hypothetical protein